MKLPPRKPRPTGRLPQLNKRYRLVRRALGQWSAPEQQQPLALAELIPAWNYTP